ncbi:hypothetical protein AALO_G00209600 [Alosa alosa]|uniref:Palmdelphin n=2 Tax=Alosa alosa TaxID=278164 RepID=A0AAV6FZE5_9TELE|nr:palmdelphin isoform X1 [Alosa alosa]XP_048122829.1 palmdelphin isoform X1 [Alosa alosa]KAG5268219.1 hypothetical protein AALO_G00209600 [Alosa alosa]
MEEADLLKERLQAITDKRRVQEDIAKKRRQIEEEKLKLQYLKKKALREQWLMDGLSGQTEEEQEALKTQAQDDQQQTKLLQSNISRIEEEIETLEAEEIRISSNEQHILKRLKEVEKTAEDIIKGATTELTEVDGKELSEGSSPSQNQAESLSKAVTMETSEQLESGNVADFEQEPQETELPENESSSNNDEQDCYEEFLETMGSKVVVDILADLPPSMTSELDDIPCPKEALILEATPEELNHHESVTSLSKPPSSGESVCENESAPKTQEPLVEDQSEDALPDLFDTEEPEDPEDAMKALNLMPTDDAVDNFTSDEVEESMLEQFIREEALSEVSTESCHDPEELDECLHVEIAVASSDSEGDDKWRTIFSSSINKEDDDSYLDSLQLSAQELFVQKPSIDNEEDDPKDVNQKSESEIPLGDEILEQPETDSDFEKREVTYTTPTLFHGLSKISEDDEETGKGSNNKHTSQHSEGDKKLPKDYCVIQEMKSENVSTEHVDFRVARKQWLEMEEQTKMAKTTVQSPTTPKPGLCQGSHSFMYTPVRNIDRPRRDPDFENLALGGDYPHTQFSPCSEDSGLDDLSYRSPYDDPETPVEREIRLTMEREENFRRERALSSSSSCEFVQAKARPVVIHSTKLCQEVDEKRKMFEHQDDGCNIPRSPSNPTPSFIITSSPVKGAQKREFAANNVIILEPDPYPCSPKRYGKDMGAAHPGNWNSNEPSNVIILETSNLIIRSASEFCLNSAAEENQDSMFLNNPFFKLRSRSTQSLIDEEIKMVKQREEELRRQRASMYTKEKFNTIVVSPNLLNSAFDTSEEMPIKCKSSPSSPMKTYKMDRSIVSCDNRFPEMYLGGRRKSAMALRWEAGEFANNQ